MNQKQTALLTISLPRAMAAQVEKIRKAEHRTRSELVREALRTYFTLAQRFPEDHATPAELRAFQQGRRAFARGRAVTLAQLLNELEPLNSRPRPKKAQASVRK